MTEMTPEEMGDDAREPEIESREQLLRGWRDRALAAEAREAKLREVLEGLAKRHEGYEHGCGPCRCEWHQKARQALKDKSND